MLSAILFWSAMAAAQASSTSSSTVPGTETEQQSRPLMDNFITLKIDPETLIGKLDDPLPLWPAPEQEHYQRSWISGCSSIGHLGAKDSVSYGALDFDRDGKLLFRTKYQVLAQGPYGTIFAKSVYYFGGQYKGQVPDFHVESYVKEGVHEFLQPVQDRQDLGALSAVSVVRVFKVTPGYLIACATYSASGKLLILDVNGSNEGRELDFDEIRARYPAVDNGTHYALFAKVREFFGLPEIFPIADYLVHPQSIGNNTGLEVFSEMVNLHYLRNRYVREDVFYPSRPRTSQVYAYPITPEDRQLQGLEDAMSSAR
jgi:hypothetical protein